MKKDDLATILVLGVPFVIGAAVHFLPDWIWIPLTFSLGLLWLGAYNYIQSLPRD